MKEIPVSQIKGFKIGHAQDLEHATGCTAILCEQGAWPAWTSGAEAPLPGRRSFSVP